MRYLAFDIECAGTYGLFTPICNFGYVIYDHQKMLIEKQDIIINPATKFKLNGRPGRPDVNLHYTKKEYRSAPTFDRVYDEIRRLLEHDDQMIVNHAVLNDMVYLKNACGRYKLPVINFSAYDTAGIYQAFHGKSKNHLNLSAMGKALDIREFQEHKADDDANAAMMILFELAHLLEMSPEELAIASNVKAYISANLDKHIKKRLQAYLVQLIKKATQLQQTGNTFINQTICASLKLEQDADEIEALIKFIYANGGKYSSKISEANVFIYDEKHHCKRCNSFIHNQEVGRDIILMDYEEYKRLMLEWAFNHPQALIG